MIKVTKHGVVYRTAPHFICHDCGCEYNADFEDCSIKRDCYETIDGIYLEEHLCGFYLDHECPECGAQNRIYVKKPEAAP